MPIDKPELKWCEKPRVFSPDQVLSPPPVPDVPAISLQPDGAENMVATKPATNISGRINIDDPALAHLPVDEIYSKEFLTRPPGPFAFVINSPAKGGGTGTPVAMRPPVAKIPAKIAGIGTQGVTDKVFNQGLNHFPLHLAPRSLRSTGVDDNKVSSEQPPVDGNAAAIRTVCISSYVTPSEHVALMAAAKRLRQRKGELLRRAYFEHQAPIVVPEVNLKKWQELARTAANLNQITIKLNMNLQNSDKFDADLRSILSELKEIVFRLRADLKGDFITRNQSQ